MRLVARQCPWRYLTPRVGFGVSVTLPVLNRNQGAKAEAQIAITQALRRREFMESVVHAEVTAAYRRYEAAQASIQTYERGVIERASVEGKLFHRGGIAALSPGGKEESLGTHLQSLVRKELIRPDTSQLPGEDAFRFRHQLIRDAAY